MEEEHAIFVRLSRHARARVAEFNRPMASRKSGTPRLGVLHAEIDFRNAPLANTQTISLVHPKKYIEKIF